MTMMMMMNIEQYTSLTADSEYEACSTLPGYGGSLSTNQRHAYLDHVTD